MRQNLPPINRTDIPTPRRILHNHRRQSGTPAMPLRVINPRRAPTPPSPPIRSLLHARLINRLRSLPQRLQRTRQIIRMHLLIGGTLRPDLPPERRARRRADEEHLLALRRLQVLVGDLDGSGFAEIDAGAGGHDGGVGEDAVDCEGVGDGVEGADDAAEGFQGGE